MGVYLPKKKNGELRSPFYQYDFWLKPKGEARSRRYNGSTAQKTKRAAERVEANLRELAALGQLNCTTTVDDACQRYWDEKLIHSRGSDDQATILEALCVFYGHDTLLVSIGPDEVAKAAARRARTPIRRFNRRTGEVEPTRHLPSAATVNRQVVEPMRRLLRRAKKAWGLPVDLEQFDWGALKMTEPAARVRELALEEELRFWEALRPDYHPICEMYIISGRRRSDWIKLPKFKVDRTSGTVRFPTRKRKEEGEIVIELTPRELEIICEEWDKAPASEFVFTYEKRYGRDAGQRKPITVAGLRRATDNAFRDAQISDFRRHDFRHTFASRALRGKGNIRTLMAAMDHQDISSTLRYAHLEQNEVREVRGEVTVSRSGPEAKVFKISNARKK